MNKKEYNFDAGKRRAIVKSDPHKQRITIRIDKNILDWFRNKVHEAGGGNYQTLMNDALKEYVQEREGILERTLRKVIREELQTTEK